MLKWETYKNVKKNKKKIFPAVLIRPLPIFFYSWESNYAWEICSMSKINSCEIELCREIWAYRTGAKIVPYQITHLKSSVSEKDFHSALDKFNHIESDVKISNHQEICVFICCKEFQRSSRETYCMCSICFLSCQRLEIKST